MYINLADRLNAINSGLWYWSANIRANGMFLFGDLVRRFFNSSPFPLCFRPIRAAAFPFNRFHQQGTLFRRDRGSQPCRDRGLRDIRPFCDLPQKKSVFRCRPSYILICCILSHLSTPSITSCNTHKNVSSMLDSISIGSPSSS